MCDAYVCHVCVMCDVLLLSYLPKPDDHVMLITVLPSVIRVSTPIIDVNLPQTTHEKLKGETQHHKDVQDLICTFTCITAVVIYVKVAHWCRLLTLVSVHETV